MARGAPSGMRISPKSETRCHNFSFFGQCTYANLDGKKLWQRVSDFGKLPIPDGAPRAIRRFLSSNFQTLIQRPGLN